MNQISNGNYNTLVEKKIKSILITIEFRRKVENASNVPNCSIHNYTVQITLEDSSLKHAQNATDYK